MPKEKKSTSSEFSRRDFLRGGATGAISTALLGGRAAGGQASATEVEILGPGAVPVELTINGQTRRLELEPRVTLLDALRNHLDLTGSKKVCDRATCGACTVIIDGQPAYSCSVLAVEAQGRNIQTIEGLAPADNLHALQTAFVQHDAQQCGFCTPGFVMACKAFLDQKPRASRQEIESGLGGNLCRCGTYVGIRQALLDLAGKGGPDA